MTGIVVLFVLAGGSVGLGVWAIIAIEGAQRAFSNRDESEAGKRIWISFMCLLTSAMVWIISPFVAFLGGLSMWWLLVSAIGFLCWLWLTLCWSATAQQCWAELWTQINRRY